MEAATRDALRSALPQHAPTASLTRPGIGNLPTVPSFALRYNGIGHNEGALVSRTTVLLGVLSFVIFSGLFSAARDLTHHIFTLGTGILQFRAAWQRRRAERQAEADMAAWEARNPRPH